MKFNESTGNGFESWRKLCFLKFYTKNYTEILFQISKSISCYEYFESYGRSQLKLFCFVHDHITALVEKQ